MADEGPATAIHARGLTKSFGTRHALSAVDLDVAPGTVLGLLGPNGAGKTTLIRVLTTVLRADAGTFSIAGAAGHDESAVRTRVGLLPESAGVPPGETGLEILSFHGELFGLSRSTARSRAEELLALVGLSDRAGSIVSGYSRGMRQRLGIARALINDPRVVFLDEPTLGLDPAGQRQILDHIGAIARRHGTTVVLSTHVLAEVEETCDRVVILNRGSVVAEGSVAEVAERAAAPRRGWLSVAPGNGAPVEAALRALSAIGSVGHAEGRGEVDFELRAGVTAERGATEVMAALVAAGLPILGFDLERGRLSDAFLELTGQP